VRARPAQTAGRTKTEASVRAVPLQAIALAAVEELPSDSESWHTATSPALAKRPHVIWGLGAKRAQTNPAAAASTTAAAPTVASPAPNTPGTCAPVLVGDDHLGIIELAAELAGKRAWRKSGCVKQRRFAP
jgi:hypothetical protein